ncbi:MAG: CoA transferase [Deltaproteobacteria bacterium]|nr:CoA transferase [Deltaproteobacteria bacterium]
MTAPLSGIRVVELASFVAAPAAGALLADLGAEVIKVEVPWGEIYRHSRPRLAGYDSDFALAPHFHMDNRGKRSVALDLALPQAVEALTRLVDRADVLLTNMLPARLARLGLDPSALHERRPQLIVARVSGFGPVGPEANAPAFDYSSYWARTGFMDMLHEPDAPPAFQRPGMGDHSAALALVTGILAALRQRDRGAPGQVIDVALQHIGFYVTGNDTAMTLVTGQTPPRHDRRAARNPLWNHYPTQDGRWVFLVMIESDRYWADFLRAVELPGLEHDPRFTDAVQRYRNRAELIGILDGVFRARPLADWREILARHRVIWAPVLTLAEAVADPQAERFGSFPTVDHPGVGPFRTVAPPLQMSGHGMPGTAPAPELSADSELVLRELGLSEDDVALLLAAAK